VPPHLNPANRNGAASEYRYSRDQLLELCKGLEDAGIVTQTVSELFVGGWEPNVSNGASTTTWGRRDEQKESHGADLCWDRDAHMLPMGLRELTEEERDVSVIPTPEICRKFTESM
jgi:PERQ amino acid-rich with GYF domain-containing protein